MEISGVCSFLFWPYALTHNDPAKRAKGLELTRRMIEAARLLETENLLVVPGAAYAPWVEDFEPVPPDVCHQRLNTFRPLLDGTTDWPAVIAALRKIGYEGYLTFEYFHPWRHFPEALVYQTSDALDRMLGRKR